jgi:hypothetical protein
LLDCYRESGYKLRPACSISSKYIGELPTAYSSLYIKTQTAQFSLDWFSTLARMLLAILTALSDEYSNCSRNRQLSLHQLRGLSFFRVQRTFSSSLLEDRLGFPRPLWGFPTSSKSTVLPKCSLWKPCSLDMFV